jgi:hypothetical protein
VGCAICQVYDRPACPSAAEAEDLIGRSRRRQHAMARNESFNFRSMFLDARSEW